MIVINGEQYAENDKEFIDSLFTPGGTLRTFAKIQKRKNETLFYTRPGGGYFERIDGLFGQLSTLDNGRKFFQWTSAEIKRQ